MDPVRLGILSAANIAEAVVAGSGLVEGLRVDAIASRRKEKAAGFARRHGIRRACAYEDLIVDPEIDALYIPLPTTLAAKWAVRAALSGKHILVDKPFESETAVRAITDASNSTEVVFLDGTHFVYNARTAKVIDMLRHGHIGNVRSVFAAFTFPHDLTGDIRKDVSLEPLGAIGDLGWYCAKAAVTFLGLERTAEIEDVACFGSVFEDAPEVVREASGVVRFANGATLIFDCEFYKSVLRQRLEIVGEKGTIKMNDFVEPVRQFDMQTIATGKSIDTEFEIETERRDENNRSQPCNSEIVKVKEPISSKGAMIQEACMLYEFVRLIREKDAGKVRFWKSHIMQTQRIVDAVHKDCMERIKTQKGKKSNCYR